jgi:hypothetical protein
VRPVFTLHAGEILAGEYISRTFPDLNVWVPAKDTGVDLLVTDSKNHRSVSLQVKFSRDFLVTHLPPGFQTSLRACGWWTLHREKLINSPADYWVFVLVGFANRSTDCIVISPGELARRLRTIHGTATRLQTYLWVTQTGLCWESRGLRRDDQQRIVDGSYRHAARDFRNFLNNWRPIAQLGGRGK